MTARTREAAGCLGVYLALTALWRLCGGRFFIAWDLWQLLPWPCLYHDLAGSLLDLHSQPPLLNLALGLALKVSAATGTAAESWLYGLQLLLGAALVALTSLVAWRLIPGRALRRLLVGAFLANPYLYAEVHFYFYTIWNPCLLGATSWLALRYLERPSARRLLEALTPPLVLVHTRSLYHPVWLGLLAAGLVWHARTRTPGRARSVAMVGLLVLLAAAAWPLKNRLRFGFLGSSSWQGYNLSRGLPVKQPAVFRAFLRRPCDPLPREATREASLAVPPRFRDRPALTLLAKPDGSPNWNHHAVLGASRASGEAALRLLGAAPGLLTLRALDYYLNGWAVYEGRDVYSHGYAKEMGPAPRWARAYEIVTMLPLASYEPRATRLTTGFALLFPLLPGLACRRLWRSRHRWDDGDRIALLLVYTILWALLLVLGVDGAEGNRMRFDVQASLLLLAGWTFGQPGRDAQAGSARPAP